MIDDAELDGVIATWRQGDCALGDHWFVHRTVPDESGVDLHETSVPGFVVLTQTCDVVRSARDRDVLEVSPLVVVDAEHLRTIEKGYRPRYAYVPAVAARGLVADLDRVMTLDKRVVAGWPRVPGCTTEHEARSFAMAIGRKRTRFAFPDDFNPFAKRLQSRVLEKHGRGSPEGRALRALREIRVQAAPSWVDEHVSLLFWFIRDAMDEAFEGTNWSSLLEKWLALVPPSGRYGEVDGQVTSLERLTADEYVHSDNLDLDHLSESEQREQGDLR
jgi:hypothetical protein